MQTSRKRNEVQFNHRLGKGFQEIKKELNEALNIDFPKLKFSVRGNMLCK